jgi:hypothetical protein
VFGAAEAAEASDGVQLVAGLAQQLLGALDTLPVDLLADRAADVFPESSIQPATTCLTGPDHVLDADRLAVMFADELQGAGRRRIGDGIDVAAVPHDHSSGRDRDRPPREPAPVHQPVQQAGSLVGHHLAVAVHAGQRYRRELASLLVVVNPDHGDLLRHGQTGGLTGAEQIHGAMIALRHDPDRQRQIRQLALEPVEPIQPAAVPGGAVPVEQMKVTAGPLDGSPKTFLAAAHRLVSAEAVEAQVRKPAFQQVLGSELPNPHIVQYHPRDPHMLGIGIQGHDGNFLPRNKPRDIAALGQQDRDHAIPVPMFRNDAVMGH